MKNMQAHVRKIRSDAAECMVLSNLVTEEKRQLFGRIAEHLNSLALEIETEAATTVPDVPGAGAAPDKSVNFAEPPATPPDYQRAARSWRLLPWSLLVSSIIFALAVVWAAHRTENTVANLLPKAGSEFRAAAHELTTLLSEDKGERKALSDQLNALIARLDLLAKDLDDLKNLRAKVAAPSTNGAVSQEVQSRGTDAKPPPAEEASAHAETSGISSASPPVATQTTVSAPETASPVNESTDQVGTISTIRPESDPRKLTNGPAGCTHFRSFDPVTGTYTTFDGRRRQCR